MATFVIAEIGVNHNGQLDLALELVERMAACGASAAKFQTFKAEAVANSHAAAVAYQKISGADSQLTMLKQLELSPDEHRQIAQHCGDLGIEFMSTAFDTASLDLLCELGIRRIKIPSGEVTNIPYLKDCARRGLPLILSTGMADLEEVRIAVDVLREWMPSLPQPDKGDLPPLTVLHCTSAYPTPFEAVNLGAMQTMAESLDVPVGYSDHTQGIFIPPLAVAMGARVIEKHVTLDRSLPGPDHAASLEPSEFGAMMNAIADAETAMGDGVKAAQPAELEARGLVRRGLKAARDLEIGQVLQATDVVILRPATGLAPAELDWAIGRRLSQALVEGEPIEGAHLQ